MLVSLKTWLLVNIVSVIPTFSLRAVLQGSISVIIGVCCCTETVAVCQHCTSECTQEQPQQNSCGNQLHKVPAAPPQKTHSQGTLHFTPGPKKLWDLVNLDLVTVVTKILPNPTLLELLVRIGERTWLKQSPKFNNQAGIFKLYKTSSIRRD